MSRTHLGVKYCVVHFAVLRVLHRCLELYPCFYALSQETTWQKIQLMSLFEKEKISWMERDLIIVIGWIGKGAWILALDKSPWCNKVKILFLWRFNFECWTDEKIQTFIVWKCSSHEMHPMGKATCWAKGELRCYIENNETKQRDQSKLDDDVFFEQTTAPICFKYILQQHLNQVIINSISESNIMVVIRPSGSLVSLDSIRLCSVLVLLPQVPPLLSPAVRSVSSS